MDILIRWYAKHNKSSNTVEIIGSVVNSTNYLLGEKELLKDSIFVIECAEKLGGKLIPLDTLPKESRTSMMFFEIEFESNEKCSQFIESIKNDSS